MHQAQDQWHKPGMLLLPPLDQWDTTNNLAPLNQRMCQLGSSCTSSENPDPGMCQDCKDHTRCGSRSRNSPSNTCRKTVHPSLTACRPHKFDSLCVFANNSFTIKFDNLKLAANASSPCEAVNGANMPYVHAVQIVLLYVVVKVPFAHAVQAYEPFVSA